MGNLAVAANRETGIGALVVDLANMSCFEAIAHDLSDKGCKIVSEKVDLIKNEVGLRLEGVDKLVRGTVVAYGDNEAEISFEVKCDEPTEKRREIRRPVMITVIVCGKNDPITMKCRIVDASKSGCRLEGERLDRLPENIEISIPGLDLPITSKIVWRRDNHVGVKLNWPFEPTVKKGSKGLLERLDRKEEKQKQRPKPKVRVSAFGR